MRESNDATRCRQGCELIYRSKNAKEACQLSLFFKKNQEQGSNRRVLIFFILFYQEKSMRKIKEIECSLSRILYSNMVNIHQPFFEYFFNASLNLL